MIHCRDLKKELNLKRVLLPLHKLVLAVSVREAAIAKVAATVKIVTAVKIEIKLDITSNHLSQKIHLVSKVLHFMKGLASKTQSISISCGEELALAGYIISGNMTTLSIALIN